MGNDSDKKEKNNDYITFEQIQESVGLKNHSLFRKYLQEIFLDLSTKSEKSENKYITLLTFFDYIKLPVFIAEKLFNSLCTSNNKEGLTEEEFVDGFFKLYMGTFQETSKIIFNLLDFDKDGVIKKEDVKLILSYLPLNNVDEEKNQIIDKSYDVLGIQIKSLEEIDDIVSKTFKKFGDKMKFDQFKDTVQNRKSDVLLQIICFLYQQRPFSAKNIESLEVKYDQANDKEYEKLVKLYNSKYKKRNSVKIKPPNKKSYLSPAQSFFKKKFSISHNFALNEDEKNDFVNRSVNLTLEEDFNRGVVKKNPILSKSDLAIYEEMGLTMMDNFENNNMPLDGNISLVRLENDTTLNDMDNLNKLKTQEFNDKENIKTIVDNSKLRYNSPTKYLQEKENFNSLTLLNIDFEHNLAPINEENEYQNGHGKNDNNSNIEKNINYDNWVYKLTENKKLKKFFLSLVNKDLFYYKDASKNNFLGMHNLSGCFVQEEPEKMHFEGRDFYVFVLIFNNKSKTRKYYTPHLEIQKDFVKNIKQAIGYTKFSDFYELKEVIGKGKFGVVNLGIHKKTGEKVAVKILNKSKIKSKTDRELVKMEIGILKLCHHPNIVRLLDHFENVDYIFIVTEYIEGLTLYKFFKKKNFEFSETQASSIMRQIASGVKYLHNYGIVHRDLKPDNIMVTPKNNYGIIKIMDFGLSKIASSQEKLMDGCGTLSYVAPEVLVRSPYNKEVDIWSMGIILFYMLCGHLPFKGNKEAVLADKIVNDDLEFDEEEWETRSKKVRDLITSCLVKDPEERITIDEFMAHPWFKNNLNQKVAW